MRWTGVMVVALLAANGCGDAACKDKTLFVTFSLANVTNADGIDVSVSVAGGPAKTSHVLLSAVVAKPSIEVGFPNGYPRGQSVSVELDVKMGSVLVASGNASTTLSGSCASVAVPLTAAPTANKHQGDACGPDDICDTGNCVDGYCCDTPCAGQCQACDVAGALGTCTTTTDGVPHGTRPACNGMGGTCGGACTGASPTACTYPASSVICGAACDGKCDGMGSCSSVAGGSCPNGFACGATGCNTSCSGDQDCQPNFHCAAPNCVRNDESDCLDGKDNNGDGLADCADPTCAALVGCVPAAGAGNELGILQAGACPTDFPTTETQHQGLNAPSCGTTGCGCDPILNCQVSYDISMYTDCSSPTTINQTIPVDLAQGTSAYGPCVPFGNTGIASVKLNSVNGTMSCSSSGTTTPPAVTWNTTSNFCAAARSSATCAAQQVCVAKPPTGQTMCARIPQAGASCPAGFAGQSATWYSQALDTRACSCGCNVTQTTTCKAAATFESQATACPIGASPTDCLIGSAGSCTNNSGMFSFCHFPTTIEAFHINAGAASNTAACASTSTTSGSASPAGGSTICCQ